MTRRTEVRILLQGLNLKLNLIMWTLLIIIVNITASALSITTIINGVTNSLMEDIVFGSTLLIVNLSCLAINMIKVINEENK